MDAFTFATMTLSAIGVHGEDLILQSGGGLPAFPTKGKRGTNLGLMPKTGSSGPRVKPKS